MKNGKRDKLDMRLIAAMLTAVCLASVPAQAFDDAALAKRAYDKIILPGYANFDAAAQTLAAKSEALCKSPSPRALTAAREAMRVALVAWGRVEPIRLGPIMQAQRMERLLFYPDPRGFVTKQTAKLLAKHDDADTDPERLAGTSVAVQGFGALDIALFGEGSEKMAEAGADAAFRCRYTHALAVDIAHIARDVLTEWKGDYSRVWLNPGPENKTYLSGKETTQALYRAYVTQLEAMRTQRLASLGGTVAKPSGPLLPHSRLALPFILAGIEGERDLLGENGFTAEGLATTDKERNAAAMVGSVATDLGFALRAGDAAAAMAADPFSDAKARERLTPMVLSLKNAETIGRAAVGEMTGQSLGFNSLDGD